MGRKQRKGGGGRRPVPFDTQDHQALDTLMRWKSAQYRRTGRFDRFARPATVRLVRDLLETRAPGCSGTLSVLSVGDRPVAIHFGLRSAATLACWFPTYDVALAKYSPGLMLHLFMAEAAATAGLRRLELGKGDEEYKTLLGNQQLTVAEGCVQAAVRGRRGPPAPAPAPVRHRLRARPAGCAARPASCCGGPAGCGPGGGSRPGLEEAAGVTPS